MTGDGNFTMATARIPKTNRESDRKDSPAVDARAKPNERNARFAKLKATERTGAGRLGRSHAGAAGTKPTSVATRAEASAKP
jgi:hypothetical protein